MLTLKVQGDEHPKTFLLVTDDSDAELARLKEILVEVDAGEEIAWLDAHGAEQFKEGVEIPEGWVADFTELLEGDWPEAYEIFEKERQDAYRQAEEALGDH